MTPAYSQLSIKWKGHPLPDRRRKTETPAQQEKNPTEKGFFQKGGKNQGKSGCEKRSGESCLSESGNVVTRGEGGNKERKG